MTGYDFLPWLEQWGLFAVFFGIMLENAGIPVPGETMIIAASVLAGRGVLPFEGVLLASAGGAILGDTLGYWFGLKGGRPFFLRHGRWFGVTPEKLDRAEGVFKEKGDWAVFFGRWVALLRIFAGPLAGMMRMPYPRFLFFNAAGAVCWVGLVAGLSFFCSNQLEAIVGVFHRLGWSLLLLGFLLFFFRKK